VVLSLVKEQRLAKFRSVWASVFLAANNYGLNTVFLVFIIADVKNKLAVGLRFLEHDGHFF
jgi:hypothetical protein